MKRSQISTTTISSQLNNAQNKHTQPDHPSGPHSQTKVSPTTHLQTKYNKGITFTYTPTTDPEIFSRNLYRQHTIDTIQKPGFRGYFSLESTTQVASDLLNPPAILRSTLTIVFLFLGPFFRSSDFDMEVPELDFFYRDFKLPFAVSENT